MKLICYASIASIFAFPVLASGCVDIDEGLKRLKDTNHEVFFYGDAGKSLFIVAQHWNGDWIAAVVVKDEFCIIADGTNSEFSPFKPNA